MANVTLLHWNIYQFSNNKLNNANGAALINYIARVVAGSGAHIVSLLELKNSAVNNILAQLIPAINAANGVFLNPWRRVTINSQKNNEAYVILWRQGHGFNWLLPAAGGGVPLAGLSNQTLLATGAPGGQLAFNASLTARGGRKPFYTTFRTTDTNNTFSVVAYHAMFGRVGGITRVGVRNVGRLGQSRAVDDAGATINMDASFTSGDFNLDFNLDNADYDSLLNQLPSAQSTNERTSLVNFTPPGGFPFSVQYRANAYDNIFKYERMGVPAAGGGTVVDLILHSTAPILGAPGVLAAQAGAFVPGPILDGNLINNFPPQNFEDAWHIVRHAISDHLPVYVTMDI